MKSDLNRCRLILVANAAKVEPAQITDAVGGGDVASVVLWAGDAAEHDFANFCEALVQPLQALDIAVLVADNTQIFGRTDADGYFSGKPSDTLADDIARFSPHNVVGCGSIKDRHQALKVGELKPDFVMFGKLGGDIRPEPHRKNLALAQWWSELIEIPCIVMGGDDVKYTKDCAETGADFIGFGEAVFSGKEFSPSVAVGTINAMLDEYAPKFNEED